MLFIIWLWWIHITTIITHKKYTFKYIFKQEAFLNVWYIQICRMWSSLCIFVICTLVICSDKLHLLRLSIKSSICIWHHLAKSVLKRQQSTRKLVRKMTAKQHPVSKSAMYRYLQHCLHLKPLHLRRQPRLTAAPATETARLNARSPQLVHPGLETGALLRRVSV